MATKQRGKNNYVESPSVVCEVLKTTVKRSSENGREKNILLHKIMKFFNQYSMKTWHLQDYVLRVFRHMSQFYWITIYCTFWQIKSVLCRTCYAVSRNDVVIKEVGKRWTLCTILSSKSIWKTSKFKENTESSLLFLYLAYISFLFQLSFSSDVLFYHQTDLMSTTGGCKAVPQTCTELWLPFVYCLHLTSHCVIPATTMFLLKWQWKSLYTEVSVVFSRWPNTLKQLTDSGVILVYTYTVWSFVHFATTEQALNAKKTYIAG